MILYKYENNERVFLSELATFRDLITYFKDEFGEEINLRVLRNIDNLHELIVQDEDRDENYYLLNWREWDSSWPLIWDEEIKNEAYD